jgi:hypothetical protein
MKGVWQIVRFNWPMYAAAGVIMGLCLAALRMDGIPQSIVLAVFAVTAYFTGASLLASYWVYDVSPWAGSSWLASFLPPPYQRAWVIQTGFDPSEGRLRRQLGACTVIDLYDAPGVGGASVRRARNAAVDLTGMQSMLPQGNAETIVAAFALHEIRESSQRERFFQTLARGLTPQGRLMIIEHLRDWKNFSVFGLGFLHFRPLREWLLCADKAGLREEAQYPITPFVRVIVWRKP